MKKQTKLLSMIIALAMIISLVPSSVFADNGGTLGGNGTEDSPYQIEDAADLIAFRELVNSTAACDAYAELTEDITLSGAWTPIGTQTYVTEQYKGTFDGNNHKISGVSISSESVNQGLFGAINGATVKNLNVSGSINCGTKNYIGGIVGKMQSGTIESCSFDGSVSGGHTGGIVGGLNSTSCTISGCANYASVTGKNAGGILGYYTNSSTIENCYNGGAVAGTSKSGGIAGQLSKGTITNCYSIGDISVIGDNQLGGIYAFSNATITNCFYTKPTTQNKGGTASGEELITTAVGLKDKLGGAFVEDEDNVNDGYPLLAWQVGQEATKNPRIEISGNSTLEMTNSGAQPSAVLSVEYKDMDDTPEVEWSIVSGEECITTEEPENVDENNTKLLVTAVKAGAAVIKAVAGDYSAEFTVCVIPYITTIGYNGSNSEYAVGATVTANVNILGGEEYDYESYPELKYQWKYCDDTINYKNIPNATKREYTIEEAYEDCWLICEVSTAKTTYKPNQHLTVIGAEYAELLFDTAALSIDASDIKKATTLTLPKKGEKGTDILWTSSNSGIINAENGAVVLPDEGIVDVKLTATLSYKGKEKTRSFTIRVYSASAADEELKNKQTTLENAVNSLGEGYYKLLPVYGVDTNILEMVKADIKKQSDEDISVNLGNIEEVYGGAGIAENGDITYYYQNPNLVNAVNFAQYNVILNFSLDEASYTLKTPVTVYWDAEKVKAAMRTEVFDKVVIDEDTVVTENIVLPKIIDGKRWSVISWESSDTNVISISNKNQQTADTFFEPYVGIVRRGREDKKVTLTAKCTFGLTNDITGSEKPIILTKNFDVTVKAIDAEKAEEIENELLKKLDDGFEKVGIKNAVTGEKITEENGKYTSKYDIQLPTTRDFGVDGAETPIIITSDNDDVLVSPDVNNAARVTVIRPPVGGEASTVTLTVEINDIDTAITASRSFDFVVPALTNEEIQAEKALMNKAVEAYFDGIKGENTEKDNITSNLSPFVEVYEKDGEIVWARTNTEAVGTGIVPTALDGWETLEVWRLFKSSNPAAVAHETLRVDMQNNAKSVTVYSALSSEIFGIYGKLYKENSEKYAAYADLADLYYREVSADLIVRGKSTAFGSKPVPVSETITVSFRLMNSSKTLIAKTTRKDLNEGTTVFDVFKQVLAENNYTYGVKGTYIYEITTSDGKTISEFDDGDYSGWMYKVNGQLPDCAMGAYGLQDGDDILVYYTKNFMDDYNQGSSSSSSSGTYIKPGENDKNTDDKTNQTENKVTFKDIQGHWAKEAIGQAVEKGIMKGVSDTEFGPDEFFTRGMLVTVLYRLENEPEYKKIKFTDVADDAWYAEAVAWAKENGITEGISEGIFGPDKNLTREQMAVFMCRYADYKKYSMETKSDITSYSDYDQISDYAKTAMLWAAENKILTGRTETTLNPIDNITRAEAATVIMRFLNKY